MTGDEVVEIAAKALEAAAKDDKASTAAAAAAALDAIHAQPYAKGLRWGTLDMARAMRELVWPGLRLTREVVYMAFAKELRAMQFAETIGRRDYAVSLTPP